LRFRGRATAVRPLMHGLDQLLRRLRARLTDCAAQVRDAWRQRNERLASLQASASGGAATDNSGALSARLHRLESIFAPSASTSAHPRELSDQRAFQEAVGLLEADGVSVDTVLQYALGANWGLACAALAALPRRRDGAVVLDQVVAHFDKLYPWPMHFALEYFIAANEKRPPVGAPLAGAKEWWCENTMVLMLFREYFEQRSKLADAPVFGPAGPSQAAAAGLKAFLECVRHPYATALLEDLQRHLHTTVDRTFLSAVGRFWEDKDTIAVVEPKDWGEVLRSAEAAMLEAPARSLLVSGEHRVGKTSFLRLLCKRLERRGWVVFEASGADLMAGQQWFGQLEGRIQRTLDELSVSKKIIWYIPDILQIALSGTHQGQAASILDQILPAVAAGRLVIWTEAAPGNTARLLRLRPALRSVLEVVRLEPQSHTETGQLTQDLVAIRSATASVAVDPACVGTALDSARQYLTAGSLPGPVLDLMKMTIDRVAKEGAKRVEPADVLLTLSQLTGLPVSMLDHRERIELSAIRDYFTKRVMGQDEAVDAVVDRIAMLKAGLNDPAKPFGVLLLAGPTGTGKTELAKTAAEFLFGSLDRLIRLDMSEFQTPDSTSKILGGNEALGDADSLIGRVRKQPFAVVLLDEFEKAHASVWDLFLQVFDDGRMTDSLGHVADFRHCLIILTTNLGASSQRGSGLGFAPTRDIVTSEQVLRAIDQTFRPEFQNRLDKVIIFRPLNRDLMRAILHKELNRVLERRGIKDREWAVEWEASAQDFLLERGFSPEMGARPLKRAIEQYVIAPLAATIVEQRFPEGDQFLFIRSDGRSIQAEFVDPDGEAPPSADVLAHPRALPTMVLAPEGTDAELQVLAAEQEAISQRLLSASWEELKGELSQRMANPGFWTMAGRHDLLARLALMDRVQAAARTAEALHGRLAKGAQRSGKSSRALVGRLALQLHLLKEGIRDVFEAAPVEVAVLVEPALERPGNREATRRWCLRLLGMYTAWAGKRHMQLAELDGAGLGEMPLLLISGFGVYRLLEKEAGLHVLERPDDAKGGRATARVRLVVAPLGDLPADKLRRALVEGLERAPCPHAVVRRYRGDPSPLVRDMNGSWRSGRLDAVLGGDFDLIAASQAAQ
jgi:ATP-dependent Clp protease ATP-binding subunit ClpC